MDTTHYSLERMTTSALDMLHLVDTVAQGKAVSTAASADMLHLLLRQRVNDRLPRLLPGDVQVAHKTGNLPGTVNDVVLTVVSGSLARWLRSRGVRTEGLEMRALVPVSVRTDNESFTLGNQVSALLVSLPTHLADPKQRLASVVEATRAANRVVWTEAQAHAELF